MGAKRRQVWFVFIQDANRHEVGRIEFSDGTSSENYDRAEAEFNHLLMDGYKWPSFWAGPQLSMRWVDEDGKRISPESEGFDDRETI